MSINKATYPYYYYSIFLILLLFVGCSNQKVNSNYSRIKPDHATNVVVMNGTIYPNFIDRSQIYSDAFKTTSHKSYDKIYNMENQAKIHATLETYKSSKTFDISNPLLVLNPYGTTTTGLYIYFTTDIPTCIEYTISVDSKLIPDFKRLLYTNQSMEALTVQEGLIIGLIPGMINTVTIKAHDVNGNEIAKNEFQINLIDTKRVKELILKPNSTFNPMKLSDGLFAVFGYDRRNSNEPRHILFYDNHGVLRAEIPLDIKYADIRIENVDGYLLLPCSDNQFTLIGPTGRVMAIYEADGYMFHHDFAYDKATNKVVVLANRLSKKTKEDIVLTLDLDTGEWEETLDFQSLLLEASKRAKKPADEKKLDWLHLNTIMLINSNDIIVSSRELSSIIRVNDIYGSQTIEYIISEPSIWDGTGYEHLLLTQIGSFANTGGQHTVTYMEDEALIDGQYYLHMFNNNYGVSTTWNDYDWSQIDGIGLPGNPAKSSYFYKYLIDTEHRTYELVQSFPVPYSRIVSSSQYYDNSIVICSGVDKTFGEYDLNGNLLAEYKMDVDEFTYRVMKYSMNQYWFNESLSRIEGIKDKEKEFVQDVIGNTSVDNSQFDEFKDYSSSQTNSKGNDYSNFD